MDLAIIAAGSAHAEDLEPYKLKPELRKATTNMLLVMAASEKAFSHSPILRNENTLHAAGFVLGSSYGELGTTIGFLEQLSQVKMARPLLFQNSLHNSTLGFLSIGLKVNGPSLTVSNGVVTGENCLELAATLLSDPAMPYCIVSAVESIVKELRIDDAILVGSKGEGAATVVVTRREKAQEEHWPVLAYLRHIEYHSKSENDALMQLYHSDAVEKLVTHVTAGKKSKLNLHKIDGSQTTLIFG